MVIGHYAVAMAAKRVAPRTSLGTLIAAAILLDLIWPVLVLLGIEIVTITPGVTAVTPLTFVSYPYSHSLLMSLLWGFIRGRLFRRPAIRAGCDHSRCACRQPLDS